MSSRESTAAQILLEAVERNPDVRPAFIENACAGDAILFNRVAALLKAHGQANPLLDDERLAATLDQAPTEWLGAQIGPYKLRELLAEGGMGSVFVAEQEQPVRRKVALKVIKPGMDSRQVLSRFEAERQALALMDHPNIARVLDAGATDSGRPYFVMELVRGVAITEFCDQRKLAPRQRLELFLQVCRAIQHAHQKGVIHRDIKPSNILVTLHDDLAVPKVIDFGIAKATGQRLTEQTVYTAFNQLIGTPLYMSPEQAEMNALDVDTRSDVYSLGVLLYELLTGSTPFDSETFKAAGFDEMRRLIREVDPPRPSQRVSTLSGEDASTVSHSRGVDERRLHRALRGDLDWIAMKALEKDRNRRYESASALAADVQRHLDNDPIQAKPRTWRDHFVKWSRRHPAAVWAVILFLLSTALVSASSAVLINKAYMQEAEQRQLAEAERARAEEALKIARGAIRKSSSDLVHNLLDTPKTRLITTKLLNDGLAFYDSLIEIFGDNPDIVADRARQLMIVSDYHEKFFDFEQACDLNQEAVDTIRTLAQRFPGNKDYEQILSSSLLLWARRLNALGRYEEAAQTALQQVSFTQREVDQSPNDLKKKDVLVARLGSLMHFQFDAGDEEGALHSADIADAISEELIQKADKIDVKNWYCHQRAFNLARRGGFLMKMDRLDQAHAAFQSSIEMERRLVAENPTSMSYSVWLASGLFGLSQIKHKQNELEVALELVDESEDILRTVNSAEDRRELSEVLCLKTKVLADLDRLDEALIASQESITLIRDDPHPYSRELLPSHLHTCVHIHSKLGQFVQAHELLNESLALAVNSNNAKQLNNAAWILATSPSTELRDGVRAVELGLKGCELTEYKKADMINTLAAAYAEVGDFDSALKWGAKALQLADEKAQPKIELRLDSYRAGKPWRQD